MGWGLGVDNDNDDDDDDDAGSSKSLAWLLPEKFNTNYSETTH